MPSALKDVGDQADYYASTASPELAARWRQAVNDTIESLQEFPLRGGRFALRGSRWESLRRVPIERFPNLFLYYEVGPTTLLILRVVHVARELAPFEIENPDDPN